MCEQPEPFSSKHLSPDTIRKVQESEIEGGVFLKDLPLTRELKVLTQNNEYRIRRVDPLKPAQILIKGHPTFCPDWTRGSLHGSTWGGSMLKLGFIGRGMRMEFSIPLEKAGEAYGVLTTSCIKEVEEVSQEEHRDAGAP